MIRLKALRAAPAVLRGEEAGLPGVEIVLRRLGSAEMEEARLHTAAALRKLGAGDAVLSDYGFDRGKAPDAADAIAMAKIGSVIAAVETALLGFVSWNIVLDDDAAISPINRVNLAALMRDDVFLRIAVAHLEAASRQIALEKKDSPDSPDGSSESSAVPSVVPPIAEVAG